jgi:hypothetical protein
MIMEENKDMEIGSEKQEHALFQDACTIIEQAQKAAYRNVNEILIKRNWLLGMRIRYEVLKNKRAGYGEEIIKELATALVLQYGKGFTWRNLYNYMDFYQKHQDFFIMAEASPSEILHAVRAKSDEKSNINILHAVSAKSKNILQALTAKSLIRLSWTHYRIILQEPTVEGRAWYENEAANEMWSTRTLQRNISSQYYHRLLKSQDKDAVQHNPTIGLLLCADTDEDVAHYSVLNGSDQLFAAKYLTYMPTKEELRREIEQQKEFFRLQNGK